MLTDRRNLLHFSGRLHVLETPVTISIHLNAELPDILRIPDAALVYVRLTAFRATGLNSKGRLVSGVEQGTCIDVAYRVTAG